MLASRTWWTSPWAARVSGASLGALRAGPPLGLSGTRSWSPCLPVWWSRVLPAGPQGGGADRAPCPPGAWLLRGGCVSGGRGVAVGLSGPALPWVAGACGGACCHIKTEAQLSPRPLRTPDPGAPSLVCPSPQHSGDQEPRFPPHPDFLWGGWWKSQTPGSKCRGWWVSPLVPRDELLRSFLPPQMPAGAAPKHQTGAQGPHEASLLLGCCR